jgi:hypothetical protein
VPNERGSALISTLSSAGEPNRGSGTSTVAGSGHQAAGTPESTSSSATVKAEVGMAQVTRKPRVRWDGAVGPPERDVGRDGDRSSRRHDAPRDGAIAGEGGDGGRPDRRPAMREPGRSVEDARGPRPAPRIDLGRRGRARVRTGCGAGIAGRENELHRASQRSRMVTNSPSWL